MFLLYPYICLGLLSFLFIKKFCYLNPLIYLRYLNLTFLEQLLKFGNQNIIDSMISELIKDHLKGIIGLFIINVILIVLGAFQSYMNSTLANMPSYIPTSALAVTISGLIPIINLIFIIEGMWTLLGIFGERIDI